MNDIGQIAEQVPQKVNILIVDDREDNLLALETLLGDMNYNIIKARSGNEALKQLLSHDFAAILLDVIMPGMDGFETAEIIRQREKSQFIPIIFLTALASEAQNAFKGYATGAVDYMAKPIIPEILKAKVKVFVDLYVKNQIMLRQQEELERINRQLTNEIAERKKIENLERIALVAAKSYNAICINDMNGKVEWVNEGFSLLTGYSPAEIVGTKGEAVTRDSSLYKKNIAAVNKSKEPLSYEEKFYNKEGKEHHMLVTLTPVLNTSGGVDKILTIASDITAQKQTEEKLIEATRKAEEAVKAKQQFLANMSHEIRTPMNAIIGFTKVILKTNLNQKQKEYLNAIKLSGDALIVLINDILDLAKVDAGKMTFEHIPFRMASSVSAMIRLFEAKIQEKNLELVKDYDERIPEVVIGDPVRLHQVVLNLLSNAIKFTSTGRITVTVKVEKETDSDVGILFSVTDTGIGIPTDKLDSIFDNFQQATTDTARIYGGTGLGLAIVQKLVEGQGGKVFVESKVGEGSTFSFSLLFNKAAPGQVPVADTDIIPEKTEGKRIRILVVEDIALNQLLMKTLLDEFGFDFDIADNGKVAVKKLQKNSYDVILMDLQMPEMNGFEATEYIREKMNLDTPIIALTADVTAEDVKRCRTVGMNDYISKPVDERVLYDKVMRYVKRGADGLPEGNDPPPPVDAAPGPQKEPAQNGAVNLDYLKKHTKDNPELMKEMIRLYTEQTPPLLDTMRTAMEKQDWDSFYSAIHKMVPSFWMMGLPKEADDAAKKLKEYSKTKEHTDQIPALFATVEAACLRACDALKAELGPAQKKTDKTTAL